jgi:hypothetical protein
MNIFNSRISGEKLHDKIKIANIGACFFVLLNVYTSAQNNYNLYIRGVDEDSSPFNQAEFTNDICIPVFLPGLR